MTPEIRRAALRAAAKTALVAALGCGGGAAKPGPQNTPPPAGSAAPVEIVDDPAAETINDGREAETTLKKAIADLAELDKKLEAAVDAVIASQNDAERASAKANLDKLRADKVELDGQIAMAKVAQRRTSHVAAATACIKSLDKLAVVKIEDLAPTDPLKSRQGIYGAFGDPIARALPATQTCCNEEMIVFGSSAKHRWACCSALPALPADAAPSACTPWGPPCPPEMV